MQSRPYYSLSLSLSLVLPRVKTRRWPTVTADIPLKFSLLYERNIRLCQLVSWSYLPISGRESFNPTHEGVIHITWFTYEIVTLPTLFSLFSSILLRDTIFQLLARDSIVKSENAIRCQSLSTWINWRNVCAKRKHVYLPVRAREIASLIEMVPSSCLQKVSSLRFYRKDHVWIRCSRVLLSLFRLTGTYFHIGRSYYDQSDKFVFRR